MAAPLEMVVPNRYDNNPQKREISLEEEKKKKGEFYMDSEERVHEISLNTYLGKRR